MNTDTFTRKGEGNIKDEVFNSIYKHRRLPAKRPKHLDVFWSRIAEFFSQLPVRRKFFALENLAHVLC